jgi:RNA-directed DNA polymerase
MAPTILQTEPKEKKRAIKKLSYLLLRSDASELKEKFYALKTPEDVAKLLGVSHKRLVYHIYITNEASRYKVFEIAKKSGGVRKISTPITALKLIQRKLNQVLQAVYEVKPSVHGFVENKNIVTNAQAHAGKRYVLNLDLKDFFPSVNFGRVRGMLMAQPYNMNPEVATVLAQICCHDNQLPQGAPTSPIVTNMICAKLDSQLQRLAKEYRSTYTRYADDITFSTTLPKFPQSLAHLEEETDKVILGSPLLKIISDYGFAINEQKTRLQTRGNHQEVTGLTVNEFPNLDRTFIRQVRAMLHAWAKFGLKAAEAVHQGKYDCKSRLAIKGKPTFKQVLRGKIEFIGMVKGKDDLIYINFIEKYHFLASIWKEQKNNRDVANVEETLHTALVIEDDSTMQEMGDDNLKNDSNSKVFDEIKTNLQSISNYIERISKA